MADVFISYSRKDQEFVRRLHAGLARLKRDCWIDWKDIPLTADFRREIFAGIEAANTFVVVVSPDSITSTICRDELAHAAANNKRLVPVVHREVDAVAVPAAIGGLNWVFFRDADDFDTAFQSLIDALDTDLAWVAMHTRLLVRAIEWQTKRDDSLLLRGNDLRSAEQWLAEAGRGRERNPTPLQTDYILESRKATNRRQRLTLTAVSCALAITVVLAIIAFNQWQVAEARRTYADAQKTIADDRRQEAERQRQIALARQLAAQSELVRTQQPRLIQRSILLAIESMQRRPSLEADQALRRALEHVPRPRLTLQDAAGVRGLAFSLDGNLLATVSDDFKVTIWDIQAGQPVRRLEHASHVFDVCFSADGKQLVSAGDAGRIAIGADGRVLDGSDGVATIWDVTTGRPLLRIDNEQTIDVVVFSPDGRYVALSGEDEARICDSTTGRELGRVTISDRVDALAFDPDGKKLSVAGRREVAVCDVPAAKQVTRTPSEGDMITFSTTGRGVAVRADETGSAKVIQIPEKREIARLPGPERVDVIRLSPDGAFLVTGGNNNVARVLDVSSGQEIARVGVVGNGGVKALALSADNRFFAAADQQQREVTIWAIDAPNNPAPSQAGEMTGFTRMLAGGNYLVRMDRIANEAATVLIVDAETGAAVAQATSQGFGPEAATIDGRCFVERASLQEGPLVWDAAGKRVQLVSRETPWDPLHEVNMEISDDGTYVAVAGCYWGNVGKPPPPEFNFLRLWNVREQREMGNLAPVPCYGLDFAPDGKSLAVAADREVVVLDMVAHQPTLKIPCQTRLHAVAFDRSGIWIATGENGGIARVCNATTGKVIAVLQHEDAVVTVAFSPDGQYLATGSGDRTSRVWRIAGGEELARVTHEGPARDVGFGRSGRFLISASHGDAEGDTIHRVLWRSEDLISDACTRLTRNLTPEEWRQYIGDEPYRKTCSSLADTDASSVEVTHR